MNEQIASESKSLVGEIFHMTGQKVEVDDPIVVAALIHSQLIRRAGQDAITGIQVAVDESVRTLGEAVKAERQAAADVARATANAYAQIIEAAKAASSAQVPQMTIQLAAIVENVLSQVRREASASAPYGWKVKVALGVAGIMLLGGLAGGIVGAVWFGKGGRSVEEVREIEAGRDFLMLLPQLDQGTKEKIVRMIQRNRDERK